MRCLSTSLIDWVKVLRHTQQKIGHFGYIPPSQSLGLVLKSKNQTLQEQTCIHNKIYYNTRRIRSRFDGGGRVGGGAVSAPQMTTARRRAVCHRTITFTLLASQLDVTEPKVVYRIRPWPLGPVAWPSPTIRRPYWPKYCKNERQRAAGG